MAKKKIEVVELNLGVDLEPVEPDSVHPDTRKKINQKIRLADMEKQAMDQVRQKRQKQQEQKQSAVEQAYQTLQQAYKDNQLVELQQLQQISDTDRFSSFILRLNNYIKKRGGIWKLRKKTKNKIKYYYLTPS